ncbi:unnamed protein product [Tuber melanosporum]|uniref:(Perigord truffle) hypothetical protein n=1 Tax=Tuber melanosporum (strain Mel28) TaxID=656061 RepID=D5GAU9_TUBMM|nr:unnamed protein product [Tuber melanosporum]
MPMEGWKYVDRDYTTTP